MPWKSTSGTAHPHHWRKVGHGAGTQCHLHHTYGRGVLVGSTNLVLCGRAGTLLLYLSGCWEERSGGIMKWWTLLRFRRILKEGYMWNTQTSHTGSSQRHIWTVFLSTCNDEADAEERLIWSKIYFPITFLPPPVNCSLWTLWGRNGVSMLNNSVSVMKSFSWSFAGKG